MDTTSSPRYRLRITRGMHAGAVMELGDGELLIGSGTGGDIVLMDGAIAPQHARIRLGAGSLSMTPIDGTVRVNGEILADGEPSPELGQGDRVDLGPVSFTFETAAADEPADAGSADAAPAAAANGAAASWLLRYLPTFAAMLASQRARDWLFRLRRLRVAGQALVAFVGVVTLAAWIGSMFSSQAARAAGATTFSRDLTRLGSWVQHQAVGQLSVQHAHGRLLVTGTVGDQSQYQSLKKVLAGLVTPAVARVDVAADLATQATTLFRQLGIPAVRVSQVTGNIYRVSGYAGPAAAWSAARATVLRDMPRIGKLRAHRLETAQDRTAALRARLRDAGLANDVFLRLTGAGTLVATGVVDATALQAWSGLAQAFGKRNPAGPKLDSNVRSTRDLLGVAVRSVSVGPVSYMTTADGRRFMEGSRLPDGYYIRSISPGAITIAKQGQRFVYQLGQ